VVQVVELEADWLFNEKLFRSSGLTMSRDITTVAAGGREADGAPSPAKAPAMAGNASHASVRWCNWTGRTTTGLKGGARRAC